MAQHAARLLDEPRRWLAIPSISADPAHHGEVARSALWLADALPAADPGAPTVLVTRDGGSGPEAEIAGTLGAPLAFLGVGLPEDRIHAADERVSVARLRRGAEAAAHLWRLLGSDREPFTREQLRRGGERHEVPGRR